MKHTEIRPSDDISYAIKRIESFPKDFTYQELKKLLKHFGYQEFHKGNTSGSRVCFYDKDRDILIQLHKPYPDNVLSVAAVKSIVELLKRKGDI